MTFLEHLEDLRKRLFYSFISIFIFIVPAWFFHKDLYNILSRPVTQYLPEGTKMAYTKLTAPFMLYIKVSFLAALFLAAPFIFFQLIRRKKSTSFLSCCSPPFFSLPEPCSGISSFFLLPAAFSSAWALSSRPLSRWMIISAWP
jgi:sec-independent protein translocase protein TatC